MRKLSKRMEALGTKWPSDYTDIAKSGDYVPEMTVKIVDSDIFKVEIYYGGSGRFQENVIYDPTETSNIRSKNNNNKLTAYRYSGTKDYLWTDNITLAEIAKDPNSWKKNKNAKFYVWNHSQGSATLYTSQSVNLASKNYPINFVAKNTLIKGTWGGWSTWSKVNNTYFQLKMVVENKEYSFKFYENNKLTKDYIIQYDDAATKKYKVGGAYKIKGTENDYIYLRNTTLRDIFGNPEKWSQSADAVIEIMDYSKYSTILQIK